VNESIINEALEPSTAGQNHQIDSGTMNQVVYNSALDHHQEGQHYNMEAAEELPRDFYRDEITQHHNMKWETGDEHHDYKREEIRHHHDHHQSEAHQELSRDELNATGNWFPGLSGYVAP
jgi:hypothetical protein